MGRFIEGQPRPANAGRKKGTKNKSTEVKEDLSCKPAKEVERILLSGELKPKDELWGWLELCKLYYKKPDDTMDLTINTTPQIVVSNENVKAEIEKLMNNAKNHKDV